MAKIKYKDSPHNEGMAPICAYKSKIPQVTRIITENGQNLLVIGYKFNGWYLSKAGMQHCSEYHSIVGVWEGNHISCDPYCDDIITRPFWAKSMGIDLNARQSN